MVICNTEIGILYFMFTADISRHTGAIFFVEWSSQGVRPTTYFILVLKLRMTGAVPPFSLCMSSWHTQGWLHIYVCHHIWWMKCSDILNEW